MKAWENNTAKVKEQFIISKSFRYMNIIAKKCTPFSKNNTPTRKKEENPATSTRLTENFLILSAIYKHLVYNITSDQPNTIN